MQFDSGFIKCPLETLTKHVRQSQKITEHEFVQLSKLMKKLTRSGQAAPVVLKQLKTILSKLEGYRNKLVRSQKQSTKYAKRCDVRLKTLENTSAFAEKQEIDRLIVNHVLRYGHFDLLDELNMDVMGDVVELEVFKTGHTIVEALRNHDCGPCLQWCGANRSRLRRMECKLEFNVNIQKFVMLLQQGDVMTAVEIARKHFSEYVTTDATMVNQVMGLLAVYPLIENNVELQRSYDHLLSANRWKQLESEFTSALCQVNGLTERSTLEIVLQTGLSTLKSPFCASSGRDTMHFNVNCPTCSERVSSLVERLPSYSRANSAFVCQIGGHVMDENDPPMALPNGFVYSTSALTRMAEQNKGMVRCPNTNKRFKFKSAKTVFLV